MADILNNSIGPGSGGIENYQDGENWSEAVAQRPISNLVNNDIAINDHLIELSNFFKSGIVNGQGTNFTISLVTNNDPEMIFQVDTGMALYKKLNPLISTAQEITIDISAIGNSQKRRDLIYINVDSVLQIEEGTIVTNTPPDYAQTDVPVYTILDTIPAGFSVGDAKGIYVGSILFERNGVGNLIGSGTITQSVDYASLGDEVVNAIIALFGQGIFTGIGNEFEPSVSGFYYTIDTGRALVGNGVAEFLAAVSVYLPRFEITVGTGSPSIPNGWESVDFTGGPIQTLAQGGIYELDETVQIYNLAGTIPYTVNYDLNDQLSSNYSVDVTTGQIQKNPSATQTQVLVKYVGSKNIRYLPYITADGGVDFLSSTASYPANPAEFLSGAIPTGAVALKSILNKAGSTGLNIADFGTDFRVYMNFKIENGKLDAGVILKEQSIIAGLYALASITGDDIALNTITVNNLSPALQSSLSNMLLTLAGKTEGYGQDEAFQFLDEEAPLVDQNGDALDETHGELPSPAQRVIKSVETFVAATNLTTTSSQNYNTFSATTADIGNLSYADFTVSKVSIFVKNITNPIIGVTVTVEIYDVLAAATVMTSTPIASTALNQEAWNDFTFTPFALDFSTSYQIRVKRTGVGPSTVIPIGSASSGINAASNIEYRIWFDPAGGQYGTNLLLLDAFGDISVPSAGRLAAEKFSNYIPYAVNMGTGNLSTFQVYQGAGADNYVAIDVINGFYKFAPNQEPVSRVTFEANFNQGMAKLSTARIYREPRDAGSPYVHESLEHAIERLETTGTTTHIEPRVDGQERLYIIEERKGKFAFSSEDRNLTDTNNGNLQIDDANLQDPLHLVDQQYLPETSIEDDADTYTVPNTFEGQTFAQTYFQYTTIVDEDYIVVGTKTYEFDITDGGSPGLADLSAVAVNILTADNIDTRWAKFVTVFNGNNDGSATVSHNPATNLITITATTAGVAGNSVDAYLKSATMYSAGDSIIGITSGTLTGGGPNLNSWSVVPRFATHSGVFLNFASVGSGYSTVDIVVVEDTHGVNDDDTNPGQNAIGSVSKPRVEITTGWNFFELPVIVTEGSTYHYHIKYSGAGAAPTIYIDRVTSGIYFKQSYLPSAGLYGAENGYTIFDRVGDITIGNDSRGTYIDNSQEISTGTVDDYQLQPALDEVNGRWADFSSSGVASTYITGFSILFTEVDDVNDVGSSFTIELHDESNEVIASGTGVVPLVSGDPVEVFVDINVRIYNTSSYHIHVYTGTPTVGNVFVATNGNLTTGKWYKEYVSRAFVPFALDITDNIWNNGWDFSEPFTFAVDVTRGRILFNPDELQYLLQFLGANFNLSTQVSILQTDTIVRPNTETQENYNRRNVHFSEFINAAVPGRFLERDFIANELTLSKRNLDPLTPPDFNSPRQHATVGAYSNDTLGTGTTTVLATPITLGTFISNQEDGQEFMGLDLFIDPNNGGSPTDYDLEIEILDASPASIGTATIIASNIKYGWNFFDFSSFGAVFVQGDAYTVKITASGGAALTLPKVLENNGDTQFAFREWFVPIAGIYGTDDGVTLKDSYGDIAAFSEDRNREVFNPTSILRKEILSDSELISFAQFNNNLQPNGTTDITDYMTLYNADNYGIADSEIKVDFLKTIEYQRKLYKFYILNKRVRIKDSVNDDGYRTLSDIFCVEGDRVRRLTHNAYVTATDGLSTSYYTRKLAMDVEVNTNGVALIAVMEANAANLNDNDEITYAWEAFASVDAGGTVGASNSIFIDSANAAHVSYYDGTNGNLKYATNTTGSWVLSTVDSTGDVGAYTAIVLDSEGTVHIAYYDTSNGDLKYANNSSGTFVATTVVSTNDVGSFVSMTIDKNDDLHVAYKDVTNLDLYYVKRTSGTWGTPVSVDSTGNVGTRTSIAVDADGFVHISYYDVTNANLKYATNTTGSFVTEAVDTTGDVGGYSSIKIDSKGYVHIAYLDTTNTNLKYVHNKYNTWTATTLSTVDVANGMSLVLDYDDNYHISFQDTTAGGLMYITNATGTSTASLIHSSANTFPDSAIGIDSYGRIHVAYQDSTAGDLLYLVQQAPSIAVPIRNYTMFFDLNKMEKYPVPLFNSNGIVTNNYEKRFFLEGATAGSFSASNRTFYINELYKVGSIAWSTPIRCAIDDDLNYAVMWAQNVAGTTSSHIKTYLYQEYDFVDVSTNASDATFITKTEANTIPAAIKLGKMFWLNNTEILCHGMEVPNAQPDNTYFVYDVFSVETEKFATGVNPRNKLNSTNINVSIAGIDSCRWDSRIATVAIADESAVNKIRVYVFSSETGLYDADGFDVYVAGEEAVDSIDNRLAMISVYGNKAVIVVKTNHKTKRQFISFSVDLEERKRTSLIEEIAYENLFTDSYTRSTPISNMILARTGNAEFYAPEKTNGAMEKFYAKVVNHTKLVSTNLDATGEFIEKHSFTTPVIFDDIEESYKHSVYSAQAGKYVVTVWQESRYAALDQHESAAAYADNAHGVRGDFFVNQCYMRVYDLDRDEFVTETIQLDSSTFNTTDPLDAANYSVRNPFISIANDKVYVSYVKEKHARAYVRYLTTNTFAGGTNIVIDGTNYSVPNTSTASDNVNSIKSFMHTLTTSVANTADHAGILFRTAWIKETTDTGASNIGRFVVYFDTPANGTAITITETGDSNNILTIEASPFATESASTINIREFDLTTMDWTATSIPAVSQTNHDYFSPRTAVYRNKILLAFIDRDFSDALVNDEHILKVSYKFYDLLNDSWGTTTDFSTASNTYNVLGTVPSLADARKMYKHRSLGLLLAQTRFNVFMAHGISSTDVLLWNKLQKIDNALLGDTALTGVGYTAGRNKDFEHSLHSVLINYEDEIAYASINQTTAVNVSEEALAIVNLSQNEKTITLDSFNALVVPSEDNVTIPAVSGDITTSTARSLVLVDNDLRLVESATYSAGSVEKQGVVFSRLMTQSNLTYGFQISNRLNTSSFNPLFQDISSTPVIWKDKLFYAWAEKQSVSADGLLEPYYAIVCKVVSGAKATSSTNQYNKQSIFFGDNSFTFSEVYNGYKASSEELRGKFNIKANTQHFGSDLLITASGISTQEERYNAWLNEQPMQGFKTEYVVKSDDTISIIVHPGECIDTTGRHKIILTDKYIIDCEFISLIDLTNGHATGVTQHSQNSVVTVDSTAESIVSPFTHSYNDKFPYIESTKFNNVVYIYIGEELATGKIKCFFDTRETPIVNGVDIFRKIGWLVIGHDRATNSTTNIGNYIVPFIVEGEGKNKKWTLFLENREGELTGDETSTVLYSKNMYGAGTGFEPQIVGTVSGDLKMKWAFPAPPGAITKIVPAYSDILLATSIIELEIQEKNVVIQGFNFAKGKSYTYNTKLDTNSMASVYLQSSLATDETDVFYLDTDGEIEYEL